MDCVLYVSRGSREPSKSCLSNGRGADRSYSFAVIMGNLLSPATPATPPAPAPRSAIMDDIAAARARAPWNRPEAAEPSASVPAAATVVPSARSVAEKFIRAPHVGPNECDLTLLTEEAKSPEFMKTYLARVKEMRDARDTATWTVQEASDTTATILATITTGGGSTWSTTRQNFTLHVIDPSATSPIVQVEVHEERRWLS